jgi:hypothetical protein
VSTTARRERRVLTRVSRAAWRLDQAEREPTWALVSARAEGISIRTLAAAAGLSPSRVHQIVAAADLDALDAVLGELPFQGCHVGIAERVRQFLCRELHSGGFVVAGRHAIHAGHLPEPLCPQMGPIRCD